MKAYYNEFYRNAANWLRELINEGLIADGDVDEPPQDNVAKKTPNLNISSCCIK